MPKCSENLEVYYTAGISFDFSGHSTQFKMAPKIKPIFEHLSKCKEKVLTNYLTDSLKNNLVYIICMTFKREQEQNLLDCWGYKSLNKYFRNTSPPMEIGFGEAMPPKS